MDEYSVGGLTLAGVLGAALAWLRRRRRKKGEPKSSFRPRARLRAYISMRTHEPTEGDSLEPPPFDERDTGKRRGLRRGTDGDHQ